VTHAEALALLRDPGRYTVDDPRFSTARVVGRSMLSTDGAEHDRHRAPFAAMFRAEQVRALEPWVTAEAHRLLDGFAGRGEAELMAEYAFPLSAGVMRHVLGLDVPVADLLAWYRDVVAATVGEIPEEAGRAAFARLGQPGDVGVILFGGIETTAGMIGNAVWHGLTHGFADPEALLEESLRLEPAAAVVDRYEAGGGAKVVVSLRDANRDPAVFADPDRFDPGRPNVKRHLAFAAGPHVCLGMHLARLEGRVALSALLERVEDLELAHPAAPQGSVFRRVIDLRVNFRGKRT
jgi:cytochrome P450